jgi:DNA polymerase (family 10)
MRNSEVAQVLNEIADILELKGVQFKPRAYRRAARTIETLTEELSEIAAHEGLEEIPGIGEGIAKKIRELLDTGDLEYLHQLRKEIPQGWVELLKVPEIGPKTVQRLNKKLGIETIDDLHKAIKKHKIRDLDGFGERSEENLREALAFYQEHTKRTFIGKAYPIVQALLSHLKAVPEVKRIEVAGSVRRWRETVGDIDILVASNKPIPVMDSFVHLSGVKRVLAKGTTKSSIILHEGLQVDLRVVEPAAFGAALLYFTGSKTHNIALRRIAQKRNWKLNEYGLSDNETNEVIARKTEEEIYQALGMQWIPPELREESGELEAAQQGKIPKLITLEDIRGDLQIHTKWSDGAETIEAMVKAAKKRKYEYVAISDHSQAVTIAGGLSEEKISKQIDEVRKLDEKIPDIRILASAEVEILAEGALDFSDSLLAQLDVVSIGLHYGTKKPTEEITDRIITAMANKYVDILVHPTGRIVNQRAGYNVDLDRLIQASKKYKVYLEINSSDRHDLPEAAARRVKEHGHRMVINTDAHRSNQLDFMKYGVAIARRAWLEANDVINTKPFTEFRRLLKHVH